MVYSTQNKQAVISDHVSSATLGSNHIFILISYCISVVYHAYFYAISHKTHILALSVLSQLICLLLHVSFLSFVCKYYHQAATICNMGSPAWLLLVQSNPHSWINDGTSNKTLLMGQLRGPYVTLISQRVIYLRSIHIHISCWAQPHLWWTNPDSIGSLTQHCTFTQDWWLRIYMNLNFTIEDGTIKMTIVSFTMICIILLQHIAVNRPCNNYHIYISCTE